MRVIPWLRPNCLIVREQRPLASRGECSAGLGDPGLRHVGSCCCLQQLCTACDAGEGAFVGSEVQVSQSIAASIGDPALRQMMQPIVQPVAALAEGPQVGEPVVCRIADEIGRPGNPARSLRPHRTSVHLAGSTAGPNAAVRSPGIVFVPARSAHRGSAYVSAGDRGPVARSGSQAKVIV